MEKRKYINPEIIRIVLDNEISLILTTNPPVGPGEGVGNQMIESVYEGDPFSN